MFEAKQPVQNDTSPCPENATIPSPVSGRFALVAEQILSRVRGAKNILLHCHPSPDGDSVGSALALMHVLNNLGKSVTVVQGDSLLPASFRVLPGAERILPLRVDQVDLTAHDLFIALDSAGPEQISRTRGRDILSQVSTVVIDHHVANGGYGEINLIVPTCGATAEVLFHLFQAWGCSVNAAVATCLLVGIHSDTALKFPGTTPQTFLLGAELLSRAPGALEVVRDLERNVTPQQLNFVSLGLSNTSWHFGGRVALSSVSYSEIAARNFSPPDLVTREVVALLQRTEGCSLAVAACEFEPGAVKASLRSIGHPSALAVVQSLDPSSGGHAQASGIVLKGPLPEVTRRILDALEAFTEGNMSAAGN